MSSHSAQGRYVLDFGGRVLQSSEKNFKLLLCGDADSELHAVESLRGSRNSSRHHRPTVPPSQGCSLFTIFRTVLTSGSCNGINKHWKFY